MAEAHHVFTKQLEGIATKVQDYRYPKNGTKVCDARLSDGDHPVIPLKSVIHTGEYRQNA